MTPEERKEYWKKEIAFDCPQVDHNQTIKRHSVEVCFNHCEFSGTSYHDGAAYVKCLVDCFGEREVHDGRVTRDNRCASKLYPASRQHRDKSWKG